MDIPNTNFLNGLISCATFFDISIYLREKYFDVVWGYHLPETPRNNPPKHQFLNDLIYGASVF